MNIRKTIWITDKADCQNAVKNTKNSLQNPAWLTRGLTWIGGAVRVGHPGRAPLGGTEIHPSAPAPAQPPTHRASSCGKGHWFTILHIHPPHCPPPGSLKVASVEEGGPSSSVTPGIHSPGATPALPRVPGPQGRGHRCHFIGEVGKV